LSGTPDSRRAGRVNLNADRAKLSSRYRALRIIVLDQIHTAANLVPPHECRVEQLQQVADGVCLLESGVEPQVVGVVRQNHGHSVVDVGKERIRRLRLVANLVC